MAMTAEQKGKAVAFLTANCSCWKGQEKALNEMSAEQVLAAATIYNKAKAFDIVAERVGAPKTASLNAAMDMMGPRGAGGKGGGDGSVQMGTEDCDPDEEDCDAEDDAAGENHPGCGGRGTGRTNNGSANVERSVPRLTENEWLAMAPPAVRERDAHARRLLNREKAGIVGRLLVNVSDPARREARGKALMSRGIDELTEMLELVPAPVRNEGRRARDEDEDLSPIYLGGGFNGRTDNAADEDDEADVRDMTPPTVNARDEIIDRKLGHTR